MMASEPFQELSAALQRRQIEVNTFEGTLNLVKGRGPRARKINIDPTQFLNKIKELSPDERHCALNAYAEGVLCVMLEPKRPFTANMSYMQAAGRITPSMERKEFVDGVRDASGEEVFYENFTDHLIIAYILRLDQGLKPLLRSQMHEWDVNEARVVSAGRSSLFHTTAEAAWKHDGTHPDVHLLRVGDGFDAARITVFLDAFFMTADTKFVCGIPTKESLLFVKSHEISDIQLLQCAVNSHYREGENPLTCSLFSMQVAGPKVMTLGSR